MKEEITAKDLAEWANCEEGSFAVYSSFRNISDKSCTYLGVIGNGMYAVKEKFEGGDQIQTFKNPEKAVKLFNTLKDQALSCHIKFFIHKDENMELMQFIHNVNIALVVNTSLPQDLLDEFAHTMNNVLIENNLSSRYQDFLKDHYKKETN